MRVDPRTIRIHFERENRRIAVLDRARVLANGLPAPGSPGEPPQRIVPASAVATVPSGQLSFYFYTPHCAPRRSPRARYELAIASRIAAEKQYAAPLLHWAQRRLSSERYRRKQRARRQELTRKREQRMEACEQRCAAATRRLGEIVRRLETVRLLDTKGIQSLSGELRSLAALCADGNTNEKERKLT
jgi:hypothetical protein